ncbi:MAG TPA: hypothetical protein VK737_03870 [Opitutales bacterium]|jgi:hypothetical protein|nr:hypothetical protein [Opitutales bacterium]
MGLITGLIKKPIGCFFTIVAGLFLLLLVIGIVGVIVVDHFAVGIAAHELNQRSGFTMTVGQQDISALSGAVDLKDLEVMNPDRFASKDFLKFNEIKVKAEPTSVLGKQYIVDEININLDAFTIVRNKDGSLNLKALKDGLMPASAARSNSGPSAGIPPFLVKSFTLSIKSVSFIDFQNKGGKPQVAQINYTQTFTNVDEKNYATVVLKIGLDLKNAGYSFLFDALKEELLDPSTYLDLAKGIGGTVLDSGGAVLKGADSLLQKVVP